MWESNLSARPSPEVRGLFASRRRSAQNEPYFLWQCGKRTSAEGGTRGKNRKTVTTTFFVFITAITSKVRAVSFLRYFETACGMSGFCCFVILLYI